jgi:hypothetical protein
MTITRPKIGTLYKEQGEAISYCPKCNNNGKKQKMEERVYKPEELINGAIPGDAPLWRQCHRCWHILPIYNLKHEGRLKSELVIQRNPFDKGKTAGIQSNRLGKTNRGKNREEDFYQDEDLKREIREDNQVLGYSSSD